MVVLDLPRQLSDPGDAAGLVLARCAQLAAVTEEPGRTTRPFATPAMARANALAAGWMREAGMSTRVDAAGNLIGRRPGTDPAAGTLLLGSHLDSVRDAGAYDGPLGVLAAVAAVTQRPALPFAVEVLGFSDEEGLRYGTAYLGSGAIAGTLDPAVLTLEDADGVRLGDALRAFGGDPDRLPAARRDPDDLLGYVELHIEQGPVLEQRGRPVAVVTAIAGATRVRIAYRGQAGHAGTVPMAARRDPECAAAELVLVVEALARRTPGLVATVGEHTLLPGAPNVIPALAILTLDVRHQDDAVRAEAMAALRREAEAIGARRVIALDWTERLDTPAIEMDPGLTAQLEQAVTAAGVAPLRLPSGAGHDAVCLAQLTRTAMLFVRCAGGLSHHPDEAVTEADVAVALRVLDGFLARLAT